MAALYSTSCGDKCNQLIGPNIDLRTAYLVFAVVGFVLSILILIPLILDLTFHKILVKLKYIHEIYYILINLTFFREFL